MAKAEKGHRRLESIIDSLAASYGSGRTIDSLESAALPNKRKIIEALDHVVSSIYLGFYSTRRLNSNNLRHYLGEHMHSSYERLSGQNARAGGGEWGPRAPPG